MTKKPEKYHIYGNPWGGYAECKICGRQSRWYTTALAPDIKESSGRYKSSGILGFMWGFPLANIDGLGHYLISHWVRKKNERIHQT